MPPWSYYGFVFYLDCNSYFFLKTVLIIFIKNKEIIEILSNAKRNLCPTHKKEFLKGLTKKRN